MAFNWEDFLGGAQYEVPQPTAQAAWPTADGGTPHYADLLQQSMPDTGGFSWANFLNYQNQIQEANQQAQWAGGAGGPNYTSPWSIAAQQDAMNNQTQPLFQKEQEQRDVRTREMTPLEQFSKKAHEATEWLGSAFGNAVFGTPKEGENPYALKVENVPRFMFNLPGQVLGGVTDVAAYGSELLANSPVQEADLETNQIEDRQLTQEERFGDLGYLALGAAGFVPGVGVEARAAGLGTKVAGSLVKAAGKGLAKDAVEEAGEAIGRAGMAGIKGQPVGGIIESIGTAAGKTGAELNPYRWGDAALSTAWGATTEGLQEAWQTYFEDMRLGQLDENTGQRMLEGGVWGALGGGLSGATHSGIATAVENRRASKEASFNNANSKPMPSYYDYSQNIKDTEDQPLGSVAPEVVQRHLERSRDEDIMERGGTSMKGVSSSRNISPLMITMGARSIKRQWEKNATPDTRDRLAEMFGYTNEDFGQLMTQSNADVANELNNVVKARLDSNDHRQYIYAGESKFPATNPNFKKTYIVGNITPGNTITMHPGNPGSQNADLDGDLFNIITDADMVPYEHLTTRQLMSRKGAPNGLAQYGYGEPLFDFEHAGITERLGDKDNNNLTIQAVKDTFASHGLDEKESNYWTRQIFDSQNGVFSEKEDEKALGIKWKHKLAKTLDDIVHDDRMQSRGPIFGDEVVADVIQTLSREGGILEDVHQSVEAVGTNTNAYEAFPVTKKDVPTTGGSMPPGKSAITQVMQWWGRLHYALSENENPMFRLKQMGAWTAKQVQMLVDFTDWTEARFDNVEDQVRWTMQMINDSALPIDYLETAFKARVMREVMADLGINGTSTSSKFGQGLSIEKVISSIETRWNKNAEKYDKAISKYKTTNGELPKGTEFAKMRVEEGNDQSFARQFMDLFGNWTFSQLAAVDESMTFKGFIEKIASNPVNFDRHLYPHIEGLDRLIDACLDDYQGKQAAQIKGCISTLESGEKLRAEIKFDKDGVASWDAEYNTEQTFWHGVLINILGIDAADYLGIPGVGYLAKSGWATELLSKNINRIKRCLVAMGIRYNWRHFIDLREQGWSVETAYYRSKGFIDFSNPLNRYIREALFQYGERETGIDNAMSDKLLMDLVDPTKGSYESLCLDFDYNRVAAVRKGKDLLLYYALDDGSTKIDTSDMGTRVREAKGYVNAIENSTVAKAREYWSPLREMVGESTDYTPKAAARAMRRLAKENSIKINADAYAAGIYDAAYFAKPASDKASAGRGASLHSQAVMMMDGGFTASFLSQLGSSVGMISQDTHYKISEAIKRSLWDPTYSELISVGDGMYVELSGENLFALAGMKVDAKTELSWGHYVALFDKFPQLLGYIMPQEIVPLSTTADTVTTVMTETPKDAFIRAMECEGDLKAKYERFVDHVQNEFMADQDNLLLVMGTVDENYDELMNDSAKWTNAVKGAVRDWSKFIYEVSRLPYEARLQVINDNFTKQRARIIQSLTETIDDLMMTLELNMEESIDVAKAQRDREQMADTASSSAFKEIFGQDLEEATGEKISPNGMKVKNQILDSFRSCQAIIDYGLELIIGSESGFLSGKLTALQLEKIERGVRNLKDSSGNARFTTDEQVAEAVKSVQDRMYKDSDDAKVKASRIFITVEEGNVFDENFSPDAMISKVKEFVKSQRYKRVPSDYTNGELSWYNGVKEKKDTYGDLDRWEEIIREASSNLEGAEGAINRNLLRKQVKFWNNEILCSELQNFKDTFGKGSAYDATKRMDEARDQLAEMIEEAAADESLENAVAEASPAGMAMPHLSFNNPATSPHIEFASIELETGSAPIASGQNAGAYQALGVLDFIGKDFHCEVEPREGLTREEIIDLAKKQNSPLNYMLKSNYGKGSDYVKSISIEELEDSIRFPDSILANMVFFPQEDCVHGICSYHNPQPVTDAPGEYLGGRYTLAQFCWFLSEKKVFKSKKKRRVFAKIAHSVAKNEELKNKRYMSKDAASMAVDIRSYQEELAKYIHSVFIDEHMEKEFDLDDARIIAQFMTPMVEVTYKTSDGKTKKMTMSKAAAVDPAKFDEKMNELPPTDSSYDEATHKITPDRILMMRPISMSVIDVCMKLSNDFVNKTSESTQASNGKIPPMNELNQIVADAMDEWDGKAGTLDDLDSFLKGVPVVRKGSSRGVLLGSSPNSLQNFLVEYGENQRGDISSTRGVAMKASIGTDTERRAVASFNDALESSGKKSKGQNPFTSNLGSRTGKKTIIVKTVLPSESQWSKQERGSFRDLVLNDVSDSYYSPYAINCVLIPDVMKIEGRLADEFETAKNNMRVILIPDTEFSRSVFEDNVPDAVGVKLEGSRVTVSGRNYVAYDPWQLNRDEEDSVCPETYIQCFEPDEMAITMASFGNLRTDDSGFLLNPEFKDNKIIIDDPFTIDRKVLAGRDPVLGADILNQGMFLIGTDEDRRGDLEDQLAIFEENIANRDNKDYIPKKCRLIAPDFDKTYQVDDDVVAQRVRSYINLDKSDLQPTGVKQGSVTSGDCFGVAMVNIGGFDYYMPLMFQTGKFPVVLDSVYMSDYDLRQGKVKCYAKGSVSFEEAEGIKLIFPTLAHKTYATVMTEEEAASLPRPGFEIPISENREPGQPTRYYTTMGVYSGSTEKNRIIDAAFSSKIEMLGNLGKIIPRNFFLGTDRKLTDDAYAKFCDREHGLTAGQLEEIAYQWNNFGIWNQYIDGAFSLSADEELDGIFRKVAKSCIAARMSPAFAFANLYNGEMRYVDFNEKQIYGVLNDHELERFFHAMDPNMCYDGAGDSPGPNREGPVPMVNKDGMLLCDDGRYRYGHVHFLRPTEDSSMFGLPTGSIKWGSQAAINLGLMEGFSKNSRDVEIVLNYIHDKAGNPRAYTIGGRNASKALDGLTQEEVEKMMRDDPLNYEMERQYYGNNLPFSWSYVNRQNNIFKEETRNMGELMTLTSGKTDTEVDFSKSSAEVIRYRNAMEKLNKTLDLKVPLVPLEVHRMFKQTTASTYNDGRGSTSVPISDFCDWIDKLCSRLEHGEFPFESGATINGRPVLPYISKSLAERLIESPKLKNRNGQDWTLEMFVKEMETELDNTLEILNLRSVAQREAVSRMIDFIGGTYGKPWMSRSIGDSGLHLKDVYEANVPFMNALQEGDRIEGLHEACKAETERIKRMHERNERLRFRTFESKATEPGFIARRKTGGFDGPFGKVLRSTTSVAEAMALLNPYIPVSAIALRYKAQGLSKGLLFSYRLLPDGTITSGGIRIKNREALSVAASDPQVQKIWRAFNTLSWQGEDIIALQRAKTFEEFEELIDKRVANMTWFEKQKNRVFSWASGGGFGAAWQIENFFDRLAMTSGDSPWLSEKVDKDGTSALEVMIEQAPANLMMDLLTINEDNPDFIKASQARNWVLKNEHAAQSMFSIVMSDLFARHPFAEAAMKTGLCRFPYYAWNVGGWFLNHVAPVSSSVYIFRDLVTKMASSGKFGKLSEYLDSLGLERAQVYTSLREAIMADVLMMGSTMLVGALFGAGAFEPPDDEFYDEYAGNPSEWTICGLRLKENWWLMDILGPFAAVAATWKSIEIGKPRLDILGNWMSQALWSNPMLRASDVARSLVDPTESYIERYDNIVDQYQNIQGGPPDMMEVAMGDNISLGLNWASQFITPSFVRELFNSYEVNQIERSYKKVKNEKGEYEYTNYIDSQIRKATRKSPMLGLVLDAVTGLTGRKVSGYVNLEMPGVMIPDENQRSAMEYFSLYNLDGTERSEQEKMAIAFEALAYLQSTNDLQKLVDDGFVLPTETKIYMSQMLNDLKQYEQDCYNQWVQQTGKNAYIIGNGDYTEGQRIMNLVNQGFYGDLKEIDALFDKLWSDEMRQGLQMYYRENTTYAQTTSGEWYATGVRRTLNPLAPFLGAPGSRDWNGVTRENADGTMGHAGNWETPSEVVAGKSAGGRALVPIPADLGKRPKLSDFAGKDGYSDTAVGKAYSESLSMNRYSGYPASQPYRSYSSYGRSYSRGGGGGYSRSYGGGGGKYVANISAPNMNGVNATLPRSSFSPNTGSIPSEHLSSVGTPSMRASSVYLPSLRTADASVSGVNMPSMNLNLNTSIPRSSLSKPAAARIMNPDNIIKPNLQLRPDFQTKGSREAYRRSDI